MSKITITYEGSYEILKNKTSVRDGYGRKVMEFLSDVKLYLPQTIKGNVIIENTDNFQLLKDKSELNNIEISFGANKKRYGVVNKELNNYKKGLKVEILAEYEDKTIVGEHVYITRIIDNRKEMYKNNHKLKHVITDDVNFESKYKGIQVFSVVQIDLLP